MVKYCNFLYLSIPFDTFYLYVVVNMSIHIRTTTAMVLHNMVNYLILAVRLFIMETNLCDTTKNSG